MKLTKFTINGLLILLLGYSTAHAVVEDGIKMDWSALKLKSFGTAKDVAAASANDPKALEKAAWQDGFKKIEGFYLKQEAFAKLDKKVLTEIIKTHTRSTNTAYFADGSVRVYFETAYAAAVPVPETGLKEDDSVPSSARSSGLIFTAKGPRSPSATYRVVAEGSGEVLYSVGDVSKSGFSKNLMGRWLSPTAKNGIASSVGDTPETIEMQVSGEDFVVSKDEWKKAIDGNSSLLSEARIAIVVKK